MDEKRLQVEFEVTIVDGERGRRLAQLQAEAIVDVLRWLHDHHRGVQSDQSASALRDEPPQ